MKKYNNPQLEIICLNTADIITASNILSIFNKEAEFESKRIDVEDGFWS